MELAHVEIPVADLDPLLQGDRSAAERESDIAVRALRELGLVALRSPHVSEADNDAYLTLMEHYFSQEERLLLQDVRPEINRQAGCMEWFIETARLHAYQARIDAMRPEHRPFSHEGPNPFGRFFWHYGPRREETQFPEATSPNVIPAALANVWAPTMDRWGQKMHETGLGLSRMLAIGLGLPEDAFTSQMEFGQHLLSPTGCPLEAFSAVRQDPHTDEIRVHHFDPKPGAVMSHVHDDFNFLTGHGSSRFPGLIAWTRRGEPFRVSVPSGCLLWQVGQQLERMTGGHFEAGMHQVVVLEETIRAAARAKILGRPAVRVSSTFFLHTDWDLTLEVLEPFRTLETLARYPAMLGGEHARSVFGEMNM